LRSSSNGQRDLLRPESVVPGGFVVPSDPESRVQPGDVGHECLPYLLARRPDQANQGQGIYEGPDPPPPMAPPMGWPGGPEMPPAIIGPNECLPWCA